MRVIPLLMQEFESEATTTRKFLKKVPEDKWDWKPHTKSMDIQELTVHIANIPIWVNMAFNTKGLDFAAQPYEPVKITSAKELLEIFEDSYTKGKKALDEAKEEDLNGRWVLRNGDTVLADLSTYQTIRHALDQTTHHRAQLGVYFRLLDIPLPGSYGPTADNPQF